ncbi:MAG: hypothetical protein V7638_2484 [Acidobacteriota bacterium]
MSSRGVLSFVFVKVNVGVRNAAMTVLVNVQMIVISQRAPECADAEADDHQRDAKLQPAAYAFRNRNSKPQHDDRDRHQRQRVSGAPKRADERRPKDVFVAAHDRRDRHDVIDFGRVFQTKDQPDAENGEEAERA